MKAAATPDPFDAEEGYTIVVKGGTPPYQFTPMPSPPNPEGVTVDPQGSTATVTVPSGTPPGTEVIVEVSDSSQPPKTVVVTNHVA